MSHDFYQSIEKILIAILIGAGSVGAIGFGVRTGTDPLREEFSKFSAMATKLLEDHEQRIRNIEQVTNLAR